jgi:CheY-like chemotaxis protein
MQAHAQVFTFLPLLIWWISVWWGVVMNAANNAARAETIFLIDDEKLILQLCEMVLKHAGRRVKTFLSASACLDELRRQRPAALIFDLMMPDMDGEELIERVVELTGGNPPPLILYSAASLEQLESLRKHPHLTGVIPKEEGVGQFVRLLEKFLGK